MSAHRPFDILQSLQTDWHKSKDGKLGPGHHVHLHLWHYEGFPNPDLLMDAHSWTVFEKVDGDVLLDPELYLRTRRWDCSYETMGTAATYQDAILTHDTVIDRDAFQAHIQAASEIEIPVILYRSGLTLGFKHEYGLSIPGDSVPGVHLNWKNDGPLQWQPIINWTLDMIETLIEWSETS